MTPVAGYEILAGEYYDPVRHPTCADFRHASLHLIARYLQRADRAALSRILEVGAGRSVWCDLTSFADITATITITDRSPGMLCHSGDTVGLMKVCGDAAALPFRSGAFDLVIASLGDPYNTNAFWQEVRRVLAPGGACVFTTPAAAWADRFRGTGDAADRDVAVFATATGATLGVPSFIMAPPDQVRALQRLGLDVDEVGTFTRAMFPAGTRLSPKIASHTEMATPVVSRYVVRKPGDRPPAGDF